MRLLDFLVIGGPPIPNAVKAERMIAIFEQTKPASFCKNLLEANTAVVIVLQLIFLVALGFHGLRVHVVAAVTIFAGSLQVVLANDPVTIISKEIVYNLIIIIRLWHLASADFEHFANLTR